MQILELRDRVSTLPTLEKRFEGLIQSIQKAEEEVSSLLQQYERESHDVEQMQNESISAFLFRLVGKYEDKLKKEQLEEINAKTAYDRAVAHLEHLIQEKDELASRITALHHDEKTYQRELETRRRELSSKLSEPEGVRYTELENERKYIISQVTEIEEALKVANRAMTTADKIAKSLDSAKNWATIDAFSRGGIISHVAKYSHINEAEQNFNVLSHNLQELKLELNDVQGLTVSGLSEISNGQRIIDFWFDNIFTDLSVRSQIKDNAEKINELIKNIDKAQSVLGAKRRELENKLDKNKQIEEELLLTISE